MAFAADGAPAGHAMRRRMAESHLPDSHHGMDIHAASRNPVREVQLAMRHGNLGLAAATGPMADAVLPGAGPGGLIAPDGLAPEPDAARQDRQLFMVEGSVGALWLAMASARGTEMLPRTADGWRQGRPRSQRTMLAAALPLDGTDGALTLAARWTLIDSGAAPDGTQGAFLGTSLAPLFGLAGGRSQLAGLALDWSMASGWHLRVAGSHGWHQPHLTGAGLFTGHAGLVSTGWSAAVAGPAGRGQWTARLAQPLAIAGGGFRVGAPSGFESGTNAVTGQRFVSAAVAAREHVAELGWQRGSLSVTAFHRANAGHRAGLSDNGAALSLQAGF
jgi:hypothetical protein